MLLQRRQGWFWERSRGRVPSLPWWCHLWCQLWPCLRGGSVLCSLSHLPPPGLGHSRGGRACDGALFFQEEGSKS